MQKNCTGCWTKHFAPFGSKCKINMAVITGYKRDDEAYLVFLEDEYSRRKMEDEHKAKIVLPDHVKSGGAVAGTGVSAANMDRVLRSLDDVTGRLGRLEMNPSLDTQQAAADLLTAPLTKALSQLAEDDHDKGMMLRPETYAQSDQKSKKL